MMEKKNNKQNKIRIPIFQLASSYSPSLSLLNRYHTHEVIPRQPRRWQQRSVTNERITAGKFGLFFFSLPRSVGWVNNDPPPPISFTSFILQFLSFLFQPRNFGLWQQGIGLNNDWLSVACAWRTLSQGISNKNRMALHDIDPFQVLGRIKSTMSIQC